MKKLKIEKVYSKEYDGKNGKWKKYAVKSGDVWYTLRGKGAENIKEGDTIIGNYTTKDYEWKGENRTEHILTLLDPLIGELIERVEALEETVLELKKGAPVENPPVSPEENSQDLPF